MPTQSKSSQAKSSQAYLELPDDQYRVPDDGSFSIANAPTAPDASAPSKKACDKALEKTIRRLRDHQRMLYAQDHHAVLCIFQAMDAAGKDSTIRAVMSGLNPAGFQVYSFKQPSAEDLEHDFLWRTAKSLPERGRIGIFNRSYYEEVLVVKVHPEYLEQQRLPEPFDKDHIWEHRYESIRDHEKHLARNGTVILKFWLNVSADEQRRRFLDRINVPRKNWKFSSSDVKERGYWSKYMDAYEIALNETSRSWAPWYALPADDKPYLRLRVATILERTFESMNLKYPDVDSQQRKLLEKARKKLK